jgi:hypothetical protein
VAGIDRGNKVELWVGRDRRAHGCPHAPAGADDTDTN